MPKNKQHRNKGKMPIYIPNQPINWLFGFNGEDTKERSKELEFQKKLSLKKK